MLAVRWNFVRSRWEHEVGGLRLGVLEAETLRPASMVCELDLDEYLQLSVGLVLGF